MSALNLTANQHTLLETFNSIVDSAFGFGITYTSIPYIDPQKNWNNLRAKDRDLIHTGFKQTFALLLAGLKIDTTGVGTPASPVVVPLAKLTGGGSNGSLTIVGGLVIAVTNPT
jgi:hypothetical protein